MQERGTNNYNALTGSSKKTPLEMIDNSLTVNIEQDLYERTGKSPPKTVNRVGS